MNQLIRHNLEFDQTWQYVKKSLDEANTLSSILIKLINFKEGQFFTLLPVDANLERLYSFETGIVLTQNPIKEYVVNGQKATYSVIPTIRDELADLIVNEINQKDHLCCIIDDVIREVSDKKHIALYDTNGLIYQNEIYYLFTKYNLDRNLIIEGLNYSNAFWHSLGVLTETPLANIAKFSLTSDKLQEIVNKIKLIMVGTYDGEGYIFWEPNNVKNFPNMIKEWPC